MKNPKTPRMDEGFEPLHAAANSIFRSALDGCSIEAAFDRRIHFEGDRLERLLPEHAPGVGPHNRPGEVTGLDLKAFKRVYVIAIGKAAVPMLNTLLARMDRRRSLRGICCAGVIPVQRSERNWRMRYFEGGHPLPNEGSFAAARAALALLGKARRDTLVFFLISGGASALFDLPLDAEISLEDTMAFHQALIASGAPIAEINVIRKRFSAVKGGRLAQAAGEATKISILLPDVPLRTLDTLASGLTFPDHSTAADVEQILAKYDLPAKFPKPVRDFLRSWLRPTRLPRGAGWPA